jgi:hypothetical protein
MRQDEKALVIPDYDLSLRQAIPDNYLDELIYWRDNFDRGSWRVGDIANDLYALAVANGKTIEKYRIFGMVAQVVGRTYRSIRYYAAVAAFYPESIRREYAVLPFSHFAYAMSMRNSRGEPIYQDVLESSLAYMSERGIPPSVDSLERIFEGKPLGIPTPQLPPAPILESSLPPLPPLDLGVDEVPPASFSAYLQRASYHIQSLTGILESALRSETAITGNPVASMKVARALALLNEARNDIATALNNEYTKGASLVSLPPSGLSIPRTSGAG